MPILPQVVELYSRTIREFGHNVDKSKQEWKPYYAWEMKSDQEARRSTRLEASVGTTTAFTQIWSMIHGQLGEFKRADRETGKMYFGPKNPPGADFQDESMIDFSSLDPENYETMLKFVDILEKAHTEKKRQMKKRKHQAKMFARENKKKNPLLPKKIVVYTRDGIRLGQPVYARFSSMRENRLKEYFGENIDTTSTPDDMQAFLDNNLNVESVHTVKEVSPGVIQIEGLSVSGMPYTYRLELVGFDPVDFGYFMEGLEGLQLRHEQNPIARPYIQFFHVDQEPYDDTFKHETRKKSYEALQSSFGENFKGLDDPQNMIDFLMWQLENRKFVSGKKLNDTDFIYQGYRNLSPDPRREGFRLMNFDPIQIEIFGRLFEEVVPTIKMFNKPTRRNPLLRAYIRFSVFVDGRKVTGGETEWEPPDEHKDQAFKDRYYNTILNQYWHPKEVLLKVSPTKYQSVGKRSQVIELIGFTPDMIETFERVFDARKSKYASYAAMTDEERERDSRVKELKKMRKKYGRNPIARPLIIRQEYDRNGALLKTNKYTFPTTSDTQMALEHIDSILGVNAYAGTKFSRHGEKYVLDSKYEPSIYVFTMQSIDPAQSALVDQVWDGLKKAVEQAEKTGTEVNRMDNRYIQRSKNPDIELKGGKVLAEGKPLNEIPWEVLEENIVFYHNDSDKGNFFAPAGWFFLNLVDTNEHAHEVANAKEGKTGRPIIFFPGNFNVRPNFPVIWKKRMYHPGIIGAVQGQFRGGTLHIEFMSVRPRFRRNKVNTAMIEFLKSKLKPEKVVYHELTKEGKEFHKSRVGEKAQNPIIKPNVWMYNSDFTKKILPRGNDRLVIHFGKNLAELSHPTSMKNFLHSFGFTDLRSGEQLAPADYKITGIDRMSGYKTIHFRLNNFTPDQVEAFSEGFENVFESRKKSNPVGGLAEGMSPSDFDPKELARGTKVEMEHTSDPTIAQEIAMDHLVEDPKYYRKLAKMEKNPILKAHILQEWFGPSDLGTEAGSPRQFIVSNQHEADLEEVLDAVFRRHLGSKTTVRMQGETIQIVLPNGSYTSFKMVCGSPDQNMTFKNWFKKLSQDQDAIKKEAYHLKKVAKIIRRPNPESDWGLIEKAFNPEDRRSSNRRKGDRRDYSHETAILDKLMSGAKVKLQKDELDKFLSFVRLKHKWLKDQLVIVQDDEQPSKYRVHIKLTLEEIDERFNRNPRGQPKYGGSGAKSLFDRLSYYMKHSAQATEAQLATFTRLWPIFEEIRHFGEIELNIVPEHLDEDDINATNPGAIIISFGEEGDMSVGIAGALLFEVALAEDGTGEIRDFALDEFITSLDRHSHDLSKDSLEFRVLLNQLDAALKSEPVRATTKVKE